MPWRVGLDEAGYGPNLGPLVLSSTACHVPPRAPKCLWRALSSAVRKHEDEDDGRMMIDDSKKVNDGPEGLTKLEAGVLTALALKGAPHGTVREYIATVAVGDSADDLGAEPWFNADDLLPAANPPEVLTSIIGILGDASASARLMWGPVRSVVIPAPKFNRLLDEWRLKSGVLASGVIKLLNSTLSLPGDDPIYITVDKLGGRHFYAPLLNEAFPGGWVRVIREGPERCEYEIEGLGREIHLRFEPRADGTHFNVALASMAAKYLREVCMMQFNRHWVARLPGLKPTAGYPGDASRFFEEIRGILATDGIDERTVWRER
jgi:hypothetical protein